MIWADVSFQKFLILKLHVETKLLDLNPSISEEFVTNPLIGFGNIFNVVSNKQNHHHWVSLRRPPPLFPRSGKILGGFPTQSPGAKKTPLRFRKKGPKGGGSS